MPAMFPIVEFQMISSRCLMGRKVNVVVSKPHRAVHQIFQLAKCICPRMVNIGYVQETCKTKV